MAAQAVESEAIALIPGVATAAAAATATASPSDHRKSPSPPPSQSRFPSAAATTGRDFPSPTSVLRADGVSAETIAASAPSHKNLKIVINGDDEAEATAGNDDPWEGSENDDDDDDEEALRFENDLYSREDVAGEDDVEYDECDEDDDEDLPIALPSVPPALAARRALLLNSAGATVSPPHHPRRDVMMTGARFIVSPPPAAAAPHRHHHQQQPPIGALRSASCPSSPLRRAPYRSNASPRTAATAATANAGRTPRGVAPPASYVRYAPAASPTGRRHTRHPLSPLGSVSPRALPGSPLGRTPNPMPQQQQVGRDAQASPRPVALTARRSLRSPPTTPAGPAKPATGAVSASPLSSPTGRKAKAQAPAGTAAAAAAAGGAGWARRIYSTVGGGAVAGVVKTIGGPSSPKTATKAQGTHQQQIAGASRSRNRAAKAAAMAVAGPVKGILKKPSEGKWAAKDTKGKARPGSKTASVGKGKGAGGKTGLERRECRVRFSTTVSIHRYSQ